MERTFELTGCPRAGTKMFGDREYFDEPLSPDRTLARADAVLSRVRRPAASARAAGPRSVARRRIAFPSARRSEPQPTRSAPPTPPTATPRHPVGVRAGAGAPSTAPSRSPVGRLPSSPTRTRCVPLRAVVQLSKVGGPSSCQSCRLRAKQFERAYRAGLPCHVEHPGSGKNRLRWSTPAERVDPEALLVAFADGLQEPTYPASFIARNGFRDLLRASPAAALRALPSLALSLRTALSCREDEVFDAALQAMRCVPHVNICDSHRFTQSFASGSCSRQLSAAVGPALIPHFRVFLPRLGTRSNQRRWQDRITAALQVLEANGGPEAGAAIKEKIPTYMSIT